MLVREVSRSAAVAWSPLAHRPNLLAAATLAGTMNVDFDPSGKLELFDMSDSANLGLKDPLDAACVGLTSTSERLHRLAWKNPLPNVFQDGLIVGGLGSGAINIWNPTPLLERSKQDALVSSIVSHSGPINALDFNPLQQTLLASGGPSGELYIFNLADPKKPTVHQPGTSAQPTSSGAITAVAFHPKHRHILAASSQNGTTVIWDLREKRPTFSFSDNEHRSFRPRSIAWHPNEPMHIAAASDDDESPLINIWDLHMVMSPKSTLKGHQRGVMAISWCQADKSLVVSAGRDNRTLCWDVNDSRLLSEIGSSSNWNLDVQWSPKMPTMLASTSLEGKIRVYNVSDYENLATPQSMEIASQKLHTAKNNHSSSGSNSFSLASSLTDARVMSEEDLFNIPSSSSSRSSTSSTPHQQHNGHSHHSHSQASILHAARQVQNGAIIPPRPPAWLRRPCGVSFSFGGALIGFNASSRQVSIRHVPSQKALAERAQELQNAVQSGELLTFCRNKIASLGPSQHSERETWSLLSAMVEERAPSQEILALLNIDPEVLSSTVNEYLRTLPTPAGMLEEVSSPAPESRTSNRLESKSPKPNGTGLDHSTDSSHDLFGDDDTDSGFGKFEIPESAILAQKEAQAQRGNSTSDSAATVAPTKKPLGPAISLATSNLSEEMLTKALIIGDYESAVECCVRLGRMADALVIASCGGERLWKSTQAIFFRQNKERSYLSIVAAIANRDLEDFIARIDLKHWKEGLAVIFCTDLTGSSVMFTNGARDGLAETTQSSAESLCLQLGKRLEAAGNTSAAALCFLGSGSMEDVALSWERILTSASKDYSGQPKDTEQKQMDIQELMEKVVVFSAARRLQASETPEIVLQQYTRYAELVANQGMFETALQYLSKLNIEPQTLIQEKGVAGASIAQLLDRVYHALPPTVARTYFAGNPPLLYGKTHTNVSNASAVSGDRRGGNTRTPNFTPGPTATGGPSAFSPSSHNSTSAKATGSIGGTTARVLSAPMGPAGPARPSPIGPFSGPTLGPIGGVAGATAARGETSHHGRAIATFTPITPVPPAPSPPGPSGGFVPGPYPPVSGVHGAARVPPMPSAGPGNFPHGPTATFTPLTPGNFGVTSTGAFVPTEPAVSPVPPPTSTSKASKRPIASFTPSAPSAAAPAPAPTETKLNGSSGSVSGTTTTTKKKKTKKTAAAPTASPAPPTTAGSIAFVPSGPSGGSMVAPPPTTGPVGGSGVYPAATGYGAASGVSAPVSMPAPKVAKTRVTVPGVSRVAPPPGPMTGAPGGAPAVGFAHPPPGPGGSFQSVGGFGPSSGGFAPAPAGGFAPPPAAAVGTWDPQAPLPAHLTAPYPGSGGPPPARGQVAPPSHSAPAGYYPPPTTSFQPIAGTGGAAPFQSFAPSAPAASLPPPPPNPGRAKKEVSPGTPSSTPTPVYITGPEAEAAAAPKLHDPTPEEIQLLSTLVAVLDKIAATGDPAHADLVTRFEDFKEKISGGSIPAAALPLLLSMATSMDESKYKEAQELHGAVTGSPHFHAIGSKAMLGFKRMIILISRHNI